MKIKKMSVDMVIEALKQACKTGQCYLKDLRYVPRSDNAYHLCRRLIDLGQCNMVTPEIGKWPNI